MIKEESIFEKGNPLSEEEKAHFTGTCYVNDMIPFESPYNVIISNVTFEPGSRNYWHVHPAGQILLVTGGSGWYQEYKSPARALKPGDVVSIPSGVKHWHGAAQDSWFSHLAVEPDISAGPPEWLEEVSEEDYKLLE